MENLQFWGVLEPLAQPFRWRDRVIIIEYHLLTGNEEQAVLRRRDKADESVQIIEEGLLRLTYSVVRVNGLEVPTSFEDRLTWIREWPGPLLDAALLAYDEAARQPFQALEELLADPNFEADPTANG